MLGPLVHGAYHAPGALRSDDRLFEFERVPLGHCFTHRLTIFRHAEHAERGGTMVREVAVEIAPAAIFGGIDTHHRVALSRHGRAIHLQVMSAAERGGRLPGIDRDLLSTPGAQFPQLGDGETDRCERSGAGLADAERRGQDWIADTRDFDGAGALAVPPGDGKNRAQRSVAHGLTSNNARSIASPIAR